jgi:hypothetical protein
MIADSVVAGGAVHGFGAGKRDGQSLADSAVRER